MKKTNIILAVFLSLFILSSCTDSAEKINNLSEITNSEKVIDTKKKANHLSSSKMDIIKNNINIGDIPMSKGKTEISFEFINNGKEDIILGEAETSCMCTDAVVLDSNSQNPSGKIAMRGHSAVVNVGKVIKSGEKGFVIATYDPNAHGPDATGPISRSVYIQTNSKDSPTLEFKFFGNVIK